MTAGRPKIVVVGAGFAGLKAVKQLSNADAEVLSIDRHNYHTFIPLLYQVVGGFIEPGLIAYPLRKALRKIPNASFLMAEVKQIDLENNHIITETGSIAYDYLVIATGSQTSFLEISGAPQFTFPVRTLQDAVTLRNHIISCFEKACATSNAMEREQLMTFVIVGGGPTGVEIAGTLQELICNCLIKDYSELDLRQAKVMLLQSGSSLLSSYPESLRKYTLNQLRDRGIKVHFKNRVKATFEGKVVLEDETHIATSTIIWTAGVEANLPQSEGEVTTASQNKLEVLPTLQLPEYPNVYAVGDLAYIEHEGMPLMGVAPEALQQGRAIAFNLKRQLKGKAPQTFNYFNKGTAAIVARNAGVAYLLGKIPVKGFLAWLLWLVIHLYYLPGLSNRCKLLGAWLKDYLLRERSVGLLSNK
ncbi:NAD(P)/FAD-dependent oxidoreductase [Waterburya agarophytonicola K14]|uniref:NADH:ubiquinone reductase (non-electrogenic) n=1 Tax=Waterburya agarophytonicola KI4 TaxID=2874699 RepID=A0A964BTL9_9CYAN|nr:NAD(P)/FAD-dependent oxidoreductase [Waterburya agarophytonicola]MCC0177962.1 NAD(P)/FAD-dependent oxidoreductase [Waterburya agarophytonicola KI4]